MRSGKKLSGTCLGNWKCDHYGLHLRFPVIREYVKKLIELSRATSRLYETTKSQCSVLQPCSTVPGSV